MQTLCVQAEDLDHSLAYGWPHILCVEDGPGASMTREVDAKCLGAALCKVGLSFLHLQMCIRCSFPAEAQHHQQQGARSRIGGMKQEGCCAL